MNYYIINTDKKSFQGSNDFTIWFRNNLPFTGGPLEYGEDLAQLKPEDICLMYENGVGILAVGRVLNEWDHRSYLPPMYYDIPDTPEYRIGVDWFLQLTHEPISISQLRKVLDYGSPWAPSKALTPIISGRDKIQRMIEGLSGDKEFIFSEEVSNPGELVEGAKTTVTVNAYERNTAARRICIERWGAKCVVCEMQFEQIYGPLGVGFMHVHHLTPVAAIGRQYTVNPETDLRPVCPNCHSMLHKKNPPYEIDELRTMIAERAN